MLQNKNIWYTIKKEKRGEKQMRSYESVEAVHTHTHTHTHTHH